MAALHAEGKHVVCYIEVGAAGNYYSAAERGRRHHLLRPTPQAPNVFGNKVPGYPEYYLDIRSSATVSIIESMIDQQCAAKGFDAVETDIDEEYGDNSGFPLTQVDRRAVHDHPGRLHARSGARVVDQEPRRHRQHSYATDMYPLADAVLTEQCNQYSSCGFLSAYEGQKAVFNAEYHLKPSAFCANDDSPRIQRRPLQPGPDRRQEALSVAVAAIPPGTRPCQGRNGAATWLTRGDG